MFRNHLKITLRNLFRDKVSAFINIFGFSIGLASVFFILQFVLQEWGADRFHDQADRIYRLTYDERSKLPDGRYLATTSPPMGPALAAEFPEVETAVRLRYTDQVVLEQGDKRFYENRLVYADRDFFRLFTFPLKNGDPATALAAPNTVVLTPETAQKYFGNEPDILGRSLLLDGETSLTVTGVLAEQPRNSHLGFDFLVSFSTFKVPAGYPVTLDSWGWISFHNYLLLREGVQPDDLVAKLPAFFKAHVSPDRAARAELKLQSLRDIYFESGQMMNTDHQKHGNRVYTNGLLAIAFLILAIAVLNFMNISTGRAVRRAKEVGLRKVLGARKGALISQFLGEGMVLALVSMGIGFGLYLVFQPAIARYLGWEMPGGGGNMVFLPALVVISLLAGLAASSYPALVLARFKPILALKGVLKTGSQGLNIRRVLVVFQFVVTIGLITAGQVVLRQMDYIGSKQLGYDREQVVSLQMRTDDFPQRYLRAQKILAQNPAVTGISAGDILDGDYGSVPMFPEGVDEHQATAMHILGGHFNYFKTLGVRILEGRDFSAEHPLDTATAILLNESAVRSFGWKDSPIGKKIRIDEIKEGEVIGVVEDFHYKSLHDPIQPLVAFVPLTNMEHILLRLRPGDLRETILSLEKDWQQIAPDLPFRFSFLDETVRQQYQADERFSKLISGFGALAMIIAALGLYGLLAIILQYRVREIGVRKVLGATVPGLVGLLSKDFMRLVITALVFSTPLTWYLMQNWLKNFEYRIDLTWWGYGMIALAAGALVVLIAGLTVAVQSAKAARVNPVRSLRME